MAPGQICQGLASYRAATHQLHTLYISIGLRRAYPAKSQGKFCDNPERLVLYSAAIAKIIFSPMHTSSIESPPSRTWPLRKPVFKFAFGLPWCQHYKLTLQYLLKESALGRGWSGPGTPRALEFCQGDRHYQYWYRRFHIEENHVVLMPRFNKKLLT